MAVTSANGSPPLNLMCQMVCYTEPSGKLSLESDWKRADTLKKRLNGQLDGQTIHHCLSWRSLNSYWLLSDMSDQCGNAWAQNAADSHEGELQNIPCGPFEQIRHNHYFCLEDSVIWTQICFYFEVFLNFHQQKSQQISSIFHVFKWRWDW